jgi:hypothetical protein
MEFIKNLEVTRNQIINDACKAYIKEQQEFAAFKEDYEQKIAFRDYLKEKILNDKENIYSELEKYVKNNINEKKPAITRTYTVPTNLERGMALFFDPKKYPIVAFEKAMSEFPEFEGFSISVTNATQYNTNNNPKTGICHGVYIPHHHNVSIRYEISFSE